jgi:hypothetical protein
VRRRNFVVGGLLLVGAAACKKEERCLNCGMKIDRASAWRVEIVTDSGDVAQFDSPRCAFTSWRGGKVRGKTLRAQEYYDRVWKDGRELRFVAGGDVAGPMGPDLVPIDPPRATKFIQDHGADRAYTEDEVTADVLSHLK